MPEEPFRREFEPLEDLINRLLGGVDLFGGLADLADRAAEQVREDDRSEPPGSPEATGRPAPRVRTAERYGRDLTAAARAGDLDPVVGREDEIEQVLEVLARRTKNNPVLLGDPGVGKTAIVEGIAARLVAGDVPEALRDRRLISLDLAAMVAGTRYRGDFEQRLKGVIDEVAAAGRQIVLFLDELHTVVGAGSAEGAPMDAAAILKPALARGDLQVIGATTVEDYRRHIESDGALERRFQPVSVPEPTVAQTVLILRGLRERYEGHHKVRITDEAVVAAAELSARYVTDRFLPDKAIDLVDRAGSRVRMRTQQGSPQVRKLEEYVALLEREKGTAVAIEDYERAEVLSRERDRMVVELATARAGTADPAVLASDVAEVVARATGVPVARLTTTERDRLLALEELLHRRVVGQDEAVGAVADAVRAGRAGLGHPERPVGSFLFLGPTGVGKTELARALAEALYGDVERLVRLDMSEFHDRHTVSRLVGAPPGYVGHGEGGQLTDAVRRTPYCVVLLDEIEKAHPDVFGVLLQLLDAGRLTDSKGRTADFANTVVIMTSNIGADALRAGIAAGRDVDALRDEVTTVLRARFRPEFLDRVDETVLFRGLARAELRDVTRLLLTATSERLSAQRIGLDVDDDAVDWLVERGYRPEHGARQLRRTIARELERQVSRMVLSGAVGPGRRIRVRRVEMDPAAGTPSRLAVEVGPDLGKDGR